MTAATRPAGPPALDPGRMRLHRLEEPGDWAISDQAVLVPHLARQVPDLSFIGTGCTIVEQLDALPAQCPRVAVVHDRAESVIELVDWLRAAPGRGVDLVLAQDWENLLRQLIDLDPEVAVDRFGWSGGHLIVGLTAARDGDRPAADFLRGLGAGLASRGRVPAPPACPAAQDTARLHSLVEFIAEHPSLGHTPAHGAAPDHRELVALRNDYDALARRYAALSSSRLGSLTLRYWRWRRGR